MKLEKISKMTKTAGFHVCRCQSRARIVHLLSNCEKNTGENNFIKDFSKLQPYIFLLIL